MGFFDRIRTAFGGAAGTPVEPSGPLKLAPGDGVVHYGERFLVAGVRALEFEDGPEHQYCLRDPQGALVVLVARPSDAGPVLSLERPSKADVPASGDVVSGVADGPFRLKRTGRARVHAFGDAGGASARSANLREFLDAEGERRLVVEEYGSHREVRLGEPTFEAEFEFVRAAGDDDAAPRHAAEGDAESADAPTRRGSPLAAARALLGETSQDARAPKEDVRPAEEREPTFEDERWADEHDAPRIVSVADGPAISQESEEEQWITAVRMLRHGAPAKS